MCTTHNRQPRIVPSVLMDQDPAAALRGKSGQQEVYSAPPLLQTIRRILPSPVKYAARKALIPINVLLSRLQLVIGVQPLSRCWGMDRGKPLHRYYLEQFLQEFSCDIQGHCLEFQEDSYTTRFGGAAVTQVDILHVDKLNPSATIVADLTKPNEIPSNWFDCIICTHVIHEIFELDKVVSELFRILRPGGSLLVAVPHISMYTYHMNEIWRFTPRGLHRLLAQAFEAENITVRAYGNSLTAAGELRGLATHEFRAAELAYHDLTFTVEVCARALKSR